MSGVNCKWNTQACGNDFHSYSMLPHVNEWMSLALITNICHFRVNKRPKATWVYEKKTDEPKNTSQEAPVKPLFQSWKAFDHRTLRSTDWIRTVVKWLDEHKLVFCIGTNGIEQEMKDNMCKATAAVCCLFFLGFILSNVACSTWHCVCLTGAATGNHLERLVLSND